MKISTLIAMLETVKEENGDIETGIGAAEVIQPEDYDKLDVPELVLMSSHSTALQERIGPKAYYYAEDGKI